MSPSPKFYRCGACNTKNAHVRPRAIPTAKMAGYASVSVCRRCDAGKTLRDGIDPWRGERIEAAILRQEPSRA